MNKLTLQKKTQISKELIAEIEALHTKGQTIRLMEVCGTHTVAIFKEGIRQLLPQEIELLSGPGCPVCVTAEEYIDKAIEYAKMPDTIIATFGDMLKVPGSNSDLATIQANGGDVRIVYSPLELIAMAKSEPHKRIVFLAIGFETTIAIIAAAIKMIYEEKIKNVFFLVSHKLVPSALEALLNNSEVKIDGFILPGHVSVIIGEEPYQFLAEKYRMPSVIAGFDGIEILMAIKSILKQIKNKQAHVDNVYKAVVAQKGNLIAQKLMQDLYEVVDDNWRGIGNLPNSGLKLRSPYDYLDIEKVIPLNIDTTNINRKGCQCGRVLQGIIRPDECPLFGKICTPEHPVGACMVSVEGSCAAWYKYRASSGGLTWKM